MTAAQALCLDPAHVRGVLEGARPEVIELVHALVSALESMSARVAKLEHENAQLKRILYGRSSEKIPTIDEEIRHNQADPKETVDGAPMPTDEDGKKREKRRHSRKGSEGRRKERRLERQTVESVDVPVLVREEALPEGLTRADFRAMGGEPTVVERTEYIPGRLVRFRYLLEALVSRDGQHVVRAEAPPGVGKGVQYGPGFHAHVVTAKCGDILPLYRIGQQLDRLGVHVARSTLCSVFHRSGTVMEPLYDRIAADCRNQSHVHADETPMRVQERGGCRRGWVWTLVSPRSIVYRFDPSRGAAAAQSLLGTAPAEGDGSPRSTLTIDGYSGYNAVTTDDGRTRCGCWGHARRKVFEALGSAPHARELLDLIRELYMVERRAAEADELGTHQHLARRRRESEPILQRIDEWVEKHRGLDPPTHPLATALTYLTNQREHLRRFLDNGAVPLDNNLAERALRCIAQGRKAFLFAGHDEGAQSLAVLQTIVATCKLHDLNPETYLADVLVRIGQGEDLEPLLPWNWTATT